MIYYVIGKDGKVFKGKANSWNDVSLSYGDKLYNPYTKTSIIGWNAYKQSMQSSFQNRDKK